MALLRTWTSHLLSFLLPAFAVGFLATGPHGPLASLVWFALPLTSILIDAVAAPDRRPPPPDLPEWPFDALLYGHVASQLASVGLLVAHAAQNGLWRVDTWIGVLLVGITSGWSAIVVAHELIHRTHPVHRLFGRLLLVTVLYEHFYTEHVRGHHARIGTLEDGATARFGERFWAFRDRTIPAQFRSAWRLETRRLGDVDMRLLDPRQLQNRVLHGLVAGGALTLTVAVVGGPAALAVFVAQAVIGVHLLEAVNWFEHYGLVRKGGRVRPVDSWDAESWFTRWALVGLSRHGDHHAHANRPYQQLRAFDDPPKLPYGYLTMVVLAIFADGHIRPLLEDELRRKQLGPFA